MRTDYNCEKCDECFEDLESCLKHEYKCEKVYQFTCDKCLKNIDYISYSMTENMELYMNSNKCWRINLGRADYGSRLDGNDVNFNLCDSCLVEIIKSFSLEGQEKVLNSGSNSLLSREDWLRLHRNEMPDEEMEEKGLISERQRKA